MGGCTGAVMKEKVASRNLPERRALGESTPEPVMNFSMPSYLIGVGTVVGAVALGFGGGVVLTNSAVKDTPAQSRVDRLAHSDSAPARNNTPADDAPKIEARIVPITAPAQPVQPGAAEATQAAVAPVPQTAAPQTQQAATVANPADQPGAAESNGRDDRERLARQQRVQRRAERRKYYAQQKARAQAVARMRQPQFEDGQSAKPELAFERADDGFNFFGRPSSPSPADHN